MSHYRELNKELIDQVQKMRKDMKLCYNEIVRLKAELMDKHESEVLLRKECYDWALNNFVQLIHYVQPDSDILPILKEHVQSQRRLSTFSLSTEERVAWRSKTNDKRSSEARRNSAKLTKELQRSNSVMNLRKSLRSVSPIRRDSTEVSYEDEEEEQNIQSVQQGAEEDEISQTESVPQTSTNPNIDIIFEFSGEEEEEQQDLEVESVYESVDESVDTSQTRSTLKDVTNTINATVNSLKQENALNKIVQKGGRVKKTKTQYLIDQENSTTELGSDCDIDQETLQVLREYSNGKSASGTKKSFFINQDNYHMHNEVSASTNSPTLANSDITLRNFKEATCSTPNSQRNSLSNTARTPTRTGSVSVVASEASSATSSISIRPSRQCKPKCMAEPSLREKLRNAKEPKTKNAIETKKRVKKSKSKTKK